MKRGLEMSKIAKYTKCLVQKECCNIIYENIYILISILGHVFYTANPGGGMSSDCDECKSGALEDAVDNTTDTSDTA